MNFYGKNWDNGRRQQVITIAVAAATVVSVATMVNLCSSASLVGWYHPSTARSTGTKFRTSATRCEPIIPMEQIDPSLFHSQSDEDKALMSYPFFRTNLCGGSYLELGAHDGSKYSNTYVFHKALSWKGVLIELTPSKYQRLVKNRPDDITVHAAVCNSQQTVHYVEREAASGVWEFASETFRDYWWKEVAPDLQDTIPIECQPLRDILASHSNDTEHHSSYFDMFSLDVEGAELEVLKSIDFSQAGFGVILIEADQHNVEKNRAVQTLLQQNGYIYFDNYERSDWFVNERFNEIYADVMA